MREMNEWRPELSANDRRLLDALMDVGFDRDALEPMSDSERRRVDEIMQLFGLLNDYPVDDADETLIHATQARIDRHERDVERSMSLADGPKGDRRRGRLGVRVQDLVGVAAAVLLVASVSMPLLSTMRQNAIDQSCANNLARIGFGMSAYAADHNGELPMAQAGIGGREGNWQTIANAINIGPLLDGQYCSRGHLNCPGNHDNLEMTYSYQFQRPGVRINWSGRATTVILGDRSPLVDAARAGRLLPAMTMSADHGGRGQNVLRTDGAAMWVDEQPIVGRNDNIWLPHGFDRLEAGALPEDHSDVFLAH